MPPCFVCDRRFANRDALVQHLATSSAWHPFCEKCNRRFISKEACDGHMDAKHPPMFPCTICQRTFSAQFALDDHYRGSAAHPNCVKCGRGFLDVTGREEHRQSSHPPCSRCDDKSVCEETIDEHYFVSLNHPSCTTCKVGFKDEATEKQHILSIHLDRVCIPCRETFEDDDTAKNHYVVSTRHKKCFACNIGFQYDADQLEHIHNLHAKPSEASKNEIVILSGGTTATPFLDYPPVSLRSRMFPERPSRDVGMTSWRSLPDKGGFLPPPGTAVNTLWAAQTNQQLSSLPPSRRMESFKIGSSHARAVLGLGWSPGRA